MKVREIMQTELVKINKGATYKEVAKMLKDSGVSGAPVVDEDNTLIGIVSEKDLFRLLFPDYREFYENPETYVTFEEKEKEIMTIQDMKVEDFMSRDLTFVYPDDPVLKAAALIISHSIHRLPVVEQGKVIGVVTRRHVYANIFKKYLGIE
jgi:CBS domain-containing protein